MFEREGKTNYGILYSHWKAEIIVNENDIDDMLQSFYTANYIKDT